MTFLHFLRFINSIKRKKLYTERKKKQMQLESRAVVAWVAQQARFSDGRTALFHLTRCHSLSTDSFVLKFL